MSIINNAHAGSSIRLIHLIDRVLARRKGNPIPKNDLLELCNPENLGLSPTAKNRFSSNLDFWLGEGLWQKSEEGITVLDYQDKNKPLAFRVLKLISHPFNRDDLYTGMRIAPFHRSISSLLAQHSFTFYGGLKLTSGGANNVADTLNRWLDISINNSNEASTLLSYGQFLGFLEPFESGYIVDPTRAIEPYLSQVFSHETELPIKQFVVAIAELLPMLDGGVFRQQVENMMQNKGWQLPDSHHISASLSHAIMRLSSDYRITLESRSDDSNSMQLTVPGDKRSVSVVRYREALK